MDWRAVEENLRRVRQRIFTASQAGDLKRVRSLQKLMLRSRANTLISVRRVTERNAGRMTAGVDGELVLSAEAEMKPGRAHSARLAAVARPAGQAGVHPEEEQREAAPARYPGDR